MQKEPMTSISTSPLEQWNLLSSVVKARRDPLEEEKSQLNQGTHPAYLDEVKQAKARYEQELKENGELEEREAHRINAAYQQELDALEKEYESRISELVEVLWQELEDKKRHLDADIAALEIGRWDGGFGGANSSWAHPGAHSNSHHQWANAQAGQSLPGKKQLRRRDGANPSSVLASTAGPNADPTAGPAEKKGRKRSPGAGQHCPLITQTLLPAPLIAEDMEKIGLSGVDAAGSSALGANHINSFELYRSRSSGEGQRVTDEDWEQREPGKRVRKVTLEQGKLSCDGKTYHRGQNVFINSANTNGKYMQAIITQINEYVVQFRSSISGDTRTVTATKEDMESGRVLVKKRY